MAHPVLDQQTVMNGGGPVAGPPPEEGSMSYDSEWVSKQVPNIVAAMAWFDPYLDRTAGRRVPLFIRCQRRRWFVTWESTVTLSPGWWPVPWSITIGRRGWDRQYEVLGTTLHYCHDRSGLRHRPIRSWIGGANPNYSGGTTECVHSVWCSIGLFVRFS